MPEIATAKLSIDPKLLPQGAAARVIDVGCGDGRHIARPLAAAAAVGIDHDTSSCARRASALARIASTSPS
jgi:SAM-dependent methyltransferase